VPESRRRLFRAARFEGFEQSDIRRMTAECNRVGGINLAQGLCDVAVPPPVLEAASKALSEGRNQYSGPSGAPELRRAIARRLERDNALRADPESEIVVTSGVTGAYFCTLHALLDPGDGVLLFEPYYGYHRSIARVEGLDVRFLALDPPHAPVTEDALRAAADERTRAVVVCSPSNPSGKVFTREEIEAVGRVAAERDWLVVSDEIYEYFVYDGREHVSPGSVRELWPRTVSLMGYSKTFAVTGWRLGFAVAPTELAERIRLANDLTYICAPHPLQHGVADGIETLSADWYRRLAGAFESKRDRTCAALREAGLDVLEPQGSYYVLADVRARGLERGARHAAMALLEATGVAAVPGTAFFRGPEGDHLLRFCFAKEDPVLDEACERLRSWRA